MREELAALHEASFGWALACCARDRELAADVLQDAYCRVLDGRARYDQRSAFKTWLFGVIRFTAREHRRWGVLRLSRRSEHEPADVVDPRRAPDSEAGARERAAQLARALTKLADRQREVMHLVFYEDLSVAEAAVVMGVSLGTARQHYDRGKHMLAGLLEKEEKAR
ncbi:MAG: sigma-70 family RNA polymerase sigma factor [Labilithrix sp.]|nr:sigma-70 family RNA polymerase sigma factor [Labilithrix sp.]MCW5815381.1 sigma-70 family RNA polymerase sigma factor [Labilithrix sp.]